MWNRYVVGNGRIDCSILRWRILDVSSIKICVNIRYWQTFLANKCDKYRNHTINMSFGNGAKITTRESRNNQDKYTPLCRNWVKVCETVSFQRCANEMLNFEIGSTMSKVQEAWILLKCLKTFEILVCGERWRKWVKLSRVVVQCCQMYVRRKVIKVLFCWVDFFSQVERIFWGNVE